MNADSMGKFRALFAEEAGTRLARINRLLLGVDDDGADADSISEIFREVHTLKGSAAVVGFDEVSSDAHALEERLELLRSGSATLTPALADELLVSVDRLEQLVDAAIGVDRADAPAIEPTAGKPITRPAAARPRPSSRGSIPVPVERLDEVVRLVGEASAAHVRVGQMVHERLGGDPTQVAELAGMSRVLNDLQDRAMRTQMVPISTVTDQLHRAVRDLARSLGKDVRWHVEGEQTELERHVLQQLSDALLHMVRNAADHGIEPIERRTAAGKPAFGTVRLAAAQLGSEVVISISDDGGGIEVDAVRTAAAARGIDTADLSDAEVLQLVFRSGLSTARELTDVSGRGVGLDVVHSSVEAVRGRIEIESDPGTGTMIRLIVPITLAVLSCLVVEAGGQRFGLPLHRVVVVHDHRVAITRGEGRTMLWRGDEPVPVTALADALGQPGGCAPDGPIVVVNGTLRRHAFQVDSLVGRRETVIKGLSPVLPRLDAVAGTCVEPDGSVLVVLDPPTLVERAHRRQSRAATTSPAESAARRHILVVDDALTVRELQRSILLRAGFDVSVAADGVDALARLAAGGIDLVLTDVEMPRMDGFTLTRTIRQDPALANMPVLIITTLESEHHRQQGFDAGADGYIVKASFDEAALIEAVGRVLGEDR
jgi:two-component system chemotaxis sensor kinase CheA